MNSVLPIALVDNSILEHLSPDVRTKLQEMAVGLGTTEFEVYQFRWCVRLMWESFRATWVMMDLRTRVEANVYSSTTPGAPQYMVTYPVYSDAGEYLRMDTGIMGGQELFRAYGFLGLC